MKQIIDFPNYFIDETGQVYRKWKYGFTKKEPQLTKCGYMRVDLWKNGVYCHKQVHRLVAQAFIPNPDNKPQVNHIDGNKQNNDVSNLEWATPSENQLHAYKLFGYRGSRPMLGRLGKDNPFSKPVVQIKDGIIIAEFAGINDAERITGISHQEIGRVCRGKQKTAKGYIWRYK